MTPQIMSVMTMHIKELSKKVLVLPTPSITERVKRLADDLASIPNVQVWIEDKNEVRIGVIRPIFQGVGSDLVTYSNGWLCFKKPNVVKYLFDTVRLTLFYFPSQEKEIERILQDCGRDSAAPFESNMVRVA
jgi:hypothetical protein